MKENSNSEEGKSFLIRAKEKATKTAVAVLIAANLAGCATQAGAVENPTKTETSVDDEVTPDVEEATPVEVESKYKEDTKEKLKESALEYVPGSQFETTNTDNMVAIRDEESGAIVVYQDGSKEIDETYLSIIRSELKENDVVFIGDNEAFVFNERVACVIDEAGVKESLFYNNISDSYSKSHSKVMFDQENGCCVSDGLRIKYLYDKETKGWKELENYEMLGTAQERFDQTLYNLVFERVSTGDVTTTVNFLGLDENEVIEYLKNHDETVLKSFYVAKDSNGEPAFIIVTGGEYGFERDNTIEELKGAIERLNEIDLTIVRTMADQFGCRYIAKDRMGANFVVDCVNAAAVIDELGGFLYREYPRLVDIAYAEDIALNETRGIYSVDHLENDVPVGNYLITEGSSDPNTPFVEIDKGIWTIEKIKEYKDKGLLTEAEVKRLNWLMEDTKSTWSLIVDIN